MAITYRSTKGSPLTSAEIDANFSHLESLAGSQYTSAAAYSTLVDLPATGVAQVLYRVTNDSTASNNGYYTWNGSSYTKAADLYNGSVAVGETEAVSGDTVYKKIGSGIGDVFDKINTGTIWKHPSGDSEYVGDTYYQNKGLGTYLLCDSQVYFNKISFKFGLATAHEFKVRIYSGTTAPSGTWSLSSYTLLHEETYASGDFETDENNFTTINLNTDGLTVEGGQYLLVLGRATDNTTFRYKRWSSGASAPTSTLLFSGNDYTVGWTENWSVSGYTMVPLLLEYQKNITTQINDAVDDRTDIPQKTAIAYEHVRGDSELIGDDTSYPRRGFMLYEQMSGDTVFNCFQIGVNAFIPHNFKVGIFVTSAPTRFLASQPLILEQDVTYKNSNYSYDGILTVDLDEDITVLSGEYVMIGLYGDDGETLLFYNKGFIADSGSAPYRHIHYYYNNATATPFAVSWTESTGYSTTFRLLKKVIKIDEVDVLDKILIPAEINVAIDRELNIWNDCLNEYYTINYKSDVGSAKARGYRHTGAGLTSDSLAISLWDKRKLIDYKNITINSVSKSNGSGTKQILLIGDSITDNGEYPAEINNLITTDGGFTPLFLGTQITDTIKHEGRTGWAYDTFTQSGSPFWDGTRVNFQNYMSTNSNFGGSNTIDICVINLGVNDFVANGYNPFNFDVTFKNAVTDLVNGVHDATYGYPNCKLIICLPTLPSLPKDGWALNYGAGYDYERYVYAMRLVWDYLIETYDADAHNANTSLAIVGLMVDRTYGFERTLTNVSGRSTVQEYETVNGVHPTDTGYYQFADAVYSQIRAVL